MEGLFGLYDNRVLGLLVELDVPDLLDRPRTVEELASSTGHTSRGPRSRVALRRRARVRRPAARAVSRQRGDAHAPTRSPQLVARLGRVRGERLVLETHGARLDVALRDSRSGTEAATGHDFFSFVNSVRPDAGSAFNDAMRAGAMLQAVALLDAFDWTSVDDVCDVGGGTGALLESLLTAHEHLDGVLVDLPEVLATAAPTLTAGPLAARCTLAAGSFFDPLPAGHDRYMLLAIVHDWADVDAVRILSRVRDALGEDGRAIVVENVLSDEPRDEFAAASHLMMLVLATGKERTRAQFDSLFAAASLSLVRRVKLASGFSAFELRAR